AGAQAAVHPRGGRARGRRAEAAQGRGVVTNVEAIWRLGFVCRSSIAKEVVEVPAVRAEKERTLEYHRGFHQHRQHCVKLHLDLASRTLWHRSLRGPTAQSSPLLLPFVEHATNAL